MSECQPRVCWRCMRDRHAHRTTPGVRMLRRGALYVKKRHARHVFFLFKPTETSNNEKRIETKAQKMYYRIENIKKDMFSGCRSTLRDAGRNRNTHGQHRRIVLSVASQLMIIRTLGPPFVAELSRLCGSSRCVFLFKRKKRSEQSAQKE